MFGKVAQYPGLFIKALVMTLRGDKVTRRYGKLLDWIERSSELAQEALHEANRHGLHPDSQETVVVRADGRDQDLHTILKAVKFHADYEYPYMLQNPTEHSLTAIYALNVNDMYNVVRLAESDDVKPESLRKSIEKLSEHLQAIPSSNALEN